MADIEDMDPFDRRAWYGSAVEAASQLDEQKAHVAASPGYCVRCHRRLTMPTFEIFDGHCPRCAYLAAFYPEQYDQRVRW